PPHGGRTRSWQSSDQEAPLGRVGPPYHRLSGVKARRTFPGAPPTKPYPELTNRVPPTTVGPAAFMEPPRAATLLTVTNGLRVSTSQSSLLFAVEYARR